MAVSKALFSSATDEWSTPQSLFDALHREFDFRWDAAATAENSKCGPCHYDIDDDALSQPWAFVPAVWLNPPYSMCKEFLAKAAAESQKGCTVVCLVPSRTDTRWFHAHVYDADTNAYRPGVEVRFIKGRLKFGDSSNSAPFPSMIVIFRPTHGER